MAGMKKGGRGKSGGAILGGAITQVDGLLVNEQGEALDLKKVSLRIDRLT